MGCCGDSVEVNKVAKGPLEHRECRDVVWALVFLAFWGGMLLIGGQAIAHGSPKRLVYGADSFGNLCGQDNTGNLSISNSGLDLTDRPYLYYFEPSDSTALKLCVPACPNDTIPCLCLTDCSTCQDTLSICLSSLNSPYTIEGVNGTDADNEGCPAVALESSDLLHLHRCIPTANVSEAAGAYNLQNQADLFEQITADFYNARFAFMVCLGAAVAISLLMVLLMRCCAGPIIYVFILLASVGLIGVSGFAWRECLNAKKEYDDQPVGADDESLSRNLKLYQAGAITLTLVTILFLCLVIFMRKRIRFVVALFEEASTALARMPQVFLLPMWTSVCLLLFFALWITVYIYLSTTSTLTLALVGPDQLQRADYVHEDSYHKVWWYYVFGIFWGATFPIACQELVLASCIAIWYYTRNKQEISSPITKSVFRLLRYHLGSVAFGSLLIALVKFIRFVLAYLQAKFKNSTGKVMELVLKCLACCFWCLEKFLKFVTSNAYIEIAIYGYSFCHAAREAFKILFANILRVATLNSLGTFVLFLAKLAVVCLVGIFTMYYLEAQHPELQFPALVVVVICFFSYFIAATFIAVYRMAIDTLLICFCEDSTHNAGEHFMSDRLSKFMSAEEQRSKEQMTEKRPLLS